MSLRSFPLYSSAFDLPEVSPVMGGCRCTFRDCQNGTASQPGMHFFHFPIRDWPRLEKWAAFADKLEFKELPLAKLKNKVVCEDHFQNRMFMNYLKESLTKTAVPTLDVLSDGSVWDLETNEVGPREEWPETGESSRSTPRLVPVGNDRNRMEIQFVDALEMEVEELTPEINPPVAPPSRSEPVILNKVHANSKSSAAVDPTKTPTKATTAGAVLRKVVIKRKKSPTVASDAASSKIQVLSIQRMPTKKVASTPPAELTESSSSKDIASVATPSSSTDVAARKSPVPVQHSDPPQPPRSPVTIIDPAITEMLQRNATEIAELKKLLVDALNRPPPEPKIVRVEVPTPVVVPAAAPVPEPARPTSPVSEKGPHMNKVQLFNGVKRYLNPTMVALLRCELFGGSPDRQWKPDERTLAVELLNLGENVYDHFCDEFRFRLPPKKEVKKWKEQNDQDDDDAS